MDGKSKSLVRMNFDWMGDIEMKTNAPIHPVVRPGRACGAHGARLALAVGMLVACQSLVAGTCNNSGPPYEIPAQTSTVFLDSDCASVGGVVTVVGDLVTNGRGIFDQAGNEDGWRVDIPDGVGVNNDSSLQTIQFQSPDGELTNRGVIKNGGAGGAVLFSDSSGPGKVVNESSGQILTNGSAIVLDAGGEITNAAGGVIESGTASVVSAAGVVDITNAGTIMASGNSSQSAISANSGGEVVNSGTMIGRVNFFTGGTVSINNSGSITGLADQQGLRINGVGAIVVNSGTISAGAGFADAITFGFATNTLELHTGATVNGGVDAGSGNDSLVFGGSGSDSFSFDDVGAGEQYRNFEFFRLESGVWTFDGEMNENFNIAGGTMDLGGGVVDVGLYTHSDGIVQNGTLSAALYAFSDGTLDASIGNGSPVSLMVGTLQFGPNAELNSSGTLQLDAEATLNMGGTSQSTGALLLDNGDLINGTLTAGSFTVREGEVRASLSGAGALAKNGPGIVQLAGANDYTGGTTILDGELQGTTESLQGDIVNEAELLFSQSLDGAYAGELLGSGGLLKIGGLGAVTFTGDSSGYSGDTQITTGALFVNGRLGGDVNTISGMVGGAGVIGGTVSVAPLVELATLAPGDDGPGTLKIEGDLFLGENAILEVELGQPGGTNDLVTVAGDLTLDGTLAVSDLGGFNMGAYTLIEYTGALTDKTLELADVPAGFDVVIDTGTAGDVNLVVEPTDEMFADRFEQ